MKIKGEIKETFYEAGSTAEIYGCESSRFQAKYKTIDRQIEQYVQLSIAQFSANVFTNFNQAMLQQALSSTPPKGTRFRTPQEELSIILTRYIPDSNDLIMSPGEESN